MGQTGEMQLTIISGASSGIGAALAAAAESQGHTVATISRRPGPGRYLEADLSDPSSWPTVRAWMADLCSSESWERIVFIHNAGVINPVGFAGEVDPAAYTTNILLNGAAPVVLGASFLTSATAAACPAHLMMISSGAGRRAIKGWSSYCAGKSATDMWAASAGLEQSFRDSAITVTSVAPGVVDTDMQGTIRDQGAEGFPDLANFIGLKESGSLRSADDVASTLLALSAVDAGDTFGGVSIENGAILRIDEFE